jgi:hypothetical protein
VQTCGVELDDLPQENDRLDPGRWLEERVRTGGQCPSAVRHGREQTLSQ